MIERPITSKSMLPPEHGNERGTMMGATQPAPSPAGRPFSWTAITGFILSILCLIGVVLPELFYTVLPLSVLGTIFSGIGLHASQRKRGVVYAVIGLLMSLGFLAFVIVIAIAAANMV